MESAGNVHFVRAMHDGPPHIHALSDNQSSRSIVRTRIKQMHVLSYAAPGVGLIFFKKKKDVQLLNAY